MAIVSEIVNEVVNFFLKKSRRRADAMSSTESTFEYTFPGSGVLVGIRIECQACIGGFTVDLCR